MVEVKVVTEQGAIVPTQAHKNDVAIDLYTNEDAVIMPGMLGATLVGTGLHTQFDAEKYGLFISPRSSMSKLPIMLANSTGIIEGTYTGEIKIPLKNTFSNLILDAVFSKEMLQYEDKHKRFIKVPVSSLSEENISGLQDKYAKELELLYGEELKISFGKDTLPTGTLYIPKHTRLVQAYLIPRFDVELTEVETLDETERGSNGFGSSGNTIDN